MDLWLGLGVGIGLSAACGFRVFVPLLALSLASWTNYLTLSPEFAWIGTLPALIAFSIATCLEVGAYYIPIVDHFLDTVMTPASFVAGTIVAASNIVDVGPFLKWTLALVAGGGVAGLVQGSTVSLRFLSTATTGGIGNILMGTLELIGAVLLAILAIFLPILALFLVLGVFVVLIWRFLAHKYKKKLPVAT